MADILPKSPIKLDGFPVCVKCQREVAEDGDYCAHEGGKPLGRGALRRTLHRQVRTAIRMMMQCRTCADIPLNEQRCTGCAWMRGAAMGVAGIADQLGWGPEMVEYMKLIGKYDPGWQKRVFRVEQG